MPSVAENNKRIAKNTIILYMRLLFSMAVGLYTSRVILATLGKDDFGLNTVVASAVSIFFFLNSSMAGATSRFLTVELGKQNFEKLKKTFSAALTIHVIIAFITLVIGETIGLWYLENKMVIPESRMTAARWVYQLSLASAMITVTQVPYNAIIIAREKMNVYAYIEILRTCLMLGIVYLLVIGNFDK
ncbi:MAG: polysaccharide biosynthesis protein, partial [Tannerella sp.]|nr:polysaccharide biosynthesis protein [Tannerella sp.]